MRLDKFDVAGSYDGVEDRVVLDSIALQSKPVAAKAKASFALTRKDGAFASASGEVSAQDIKLAFPDLFRQDLALDENFAQSGLRSRAQADLMAGRHDQRRARSLAELERRPYVRGRDVARARLSAERSSPISVRDLLYHWPIGVGEGAEAWIRSQVLDGRAGPVRIEANLPAGPRW